MQARGATLARLNVRKVAAMPPQQSIEGTSAAPSKRRRVYVRKDDVILDAAERAFLESGYGDTSMDVIAERANVSKRTVYNNFATKQELFAAVVRKLCAEITPTPLDSEVLDRDPEVVLVEMAVRFLSGVYAPRQIELYRTVIAASRIFPEVGFVMFEGPIKRSQDAFSAYLGALRDRGRLSIKNPDLAAVQLIALLKTNIHMQLMMGQKLKLPKSMIKDVAASSVHLFLKGAERG